MFEQLLQVSVLSLAKPFCVMFFRKDYRHPGVKLGTKSFAVISIADGIAAVIQIGIALFPGGGGVSCIAANVKVETQATPEEKKVHLQLWPPPGLQLTQCERSIGRLTWVCDTLANTCIKRRSQLDDLQA